MLQFLKVLRFATFQFYTVDSLKSIIQIIKTFWWFSSHVYTELDLVFKLHTSSVVIIIEQIISLTQLLQIPSLCEVMFLKSSLNSIQTILVILLSQQ